MRIIVRQHKRCGKIVKQHSRSIMKLYDKSKMPKPKGKGIHTKNFHKRANEIYPGLLKKYSSEDAKRIAYATAMKQLGSKGSVKKAHQK